MIKSLNGKMVHDGCGGTVFALGNMGSYDVVCGLCHQWLHHYGVTESDVPGQELVSENP